MVLPVDRVINEIPDYTKFGRKSKLDLDPTKIPDLNWDLSTKLHTQTTPTTTVSLPSPTVVNTMVKMLVVSSITFTDVLNLKN